MKGLSCLSAILLGSLLVSAPSYADPQSDQDEIRTFFSKNVSLKSNWQVLLMVHMPLMKMLAANG